MDSPVNSATIKDEYRIIHFSDLHGGHRQVPTTDLTEHLFEQLSGLKKKDTIDILVGSGDLFDQALAYKSPEARAMTRFASKLLRFCYVHDIFLVILEGTKLHDYNQSQIFLSLNKERDHPAKLYYFDNIAADNIAGLNVIAIPDSVRGSTQVVKREVAQLMADSGVDKVHLMFTHGMYKHHMAPILHERYIDELHDSEWYASRADLIMNGHIHPPSIFKTILTAGSANRLTHGEEHAKGIWDILYRPAEGKFYPTFVENKKAHRFDTISCLSEDIAEVLRTIEQYVLDNPALETAHLRVHHAKGLHSTPVMEWVRDRFPKLTLKCEVSPTLKAKEVDAVMDKVTEFSKITTVPINRKTLPSLLENKFSRMPDVSPEQAKAALQLLKELLDEGAEKEEDLEHDAHH